MKKPNDKKADPILWPLAWVINSEGMEWPLKPLVPVKGEVLEKRLSEQAGRDVP